MVTTPHSPPAPTRTVGIGYEADVERAVALMVEALAAVEGIAAQPPAQAVVDQLSASTVDVRVLLWTSSREADVLVVRDAAIRGVKRTLQAAGVSMPAAIVELRAVRRSRDAGGPAQFRTAAGR